MLRLIQDTNTQGEHLHEQQLHFMNLCEMKRYTLLESLNQMHSKEFKRTLALWTGLIDEEANKELIKDIRDRILSPLSFEDMESAKQREYDIESLVLLADGAIDTIYVTFGLLNALGMPIEQLFNEVQTTNMAKGVNGKVLRRSDGKIMKPEGWRPPNLRAIIERHIREQENANSNTAVSESDNTVSEGAHRAAE